MNDFDNKQICSYKDIDRFGFTCDVCGRKVNGCHYINGMSFCEKCYQETFGKDNQQNEIQQLKQQLAEKDKEIAHLKEKDNYHLRYELAGADETITNLKQQLEEKDKEIKSLIADYEKRISQEQELMSNMEHRLAEKQNTIDEINKEFVQAVHDWKALCAEKDKEIEDWKQKTQTFLNRVSEQNYEIANNNPTQFAIQELEKVKNKCNGMYELWLDSNYKENMYNNEDIAGVFEDISVFTNDLVKKLKGE